MTPIPRAGRPRPTGPVMMVVGVAALSFHDGLAAALVDRVPIGQLLGLRALFAAALVLTVVRWRGIHLPSRTTVLLHGARIGCVIGSLALTLVAVRTLPLADATAILFAAPIVMSALSGRVLGEPISRSTWAAVAVGFLGVLVVVRPVGDASSATALVALAAVLYALSALLTRRLA
ncbi:MAG TPA: EamA family transporter, partial [Iamia sp.]|nr:EamA family transporter [Iamia sp.]